MYVVLRYVRFQCPVGSLRLDEEQLIPEVQPTNFNRLRLMCATVNRIDQD